MGTIAKYYTSIVELPLSKFKEVEIKNNYFALVIEGTPTIQELQNAWEDIIDQYNDKMGDGEGRLYRNLVKEVALLNSKLAKIDAAVDMLTGCLDYYSGLIPKTPEADAKIDGYYTKYKGLINEFVEAQFKLDKEKPTEYREELKRAKNRSKSIWINHQLKSKNLEAIQAKNTAGKKPDFDYYDSLLNELSIFVKYEIQDNVTTSRFCDYVLKYNKHIKFLESQTKK